MNESIELIREIRMNRDAWLPLIDHADQVFPPVNEFEDKNIGWYAGVIQDNRPFFVECWATEGITMLTIFFSVIGLENKTAGELSGIFESIGYYKVIGTERHVALRTFTDSNNNEFYSLNITVGVEDETYIEGGTIYSFKLLNELNTENEDSQQPENDPQPDSPLTEKMNDDPKEKKWMKRGFYHYRPSMDFRTMVKRYVTFSDGPDFVPLIPDDVEGRDKVAVFRMAVSPDSLKDMSHKEYDYFREIVQRLVVYFHSHNVDVDNMQVLIRNDPDGELGWRMDPDEPTHFYIDMCAESLCHWCQVIYQLSYLFTHCLLDRRSASGIIPWMEETICELMPLWILGSFMRDWENTTVGKENPEYRTHIEKYLHAYITEQKWTNEPAKCNNVQELQKLNELASERPDLRVGTVITLYYMAADSDIEALLSYGSYAMPDRKSIDVSRWLEDYPDCLTVRYLASLYPDSVFSMDDFIEKTKENEYRAFEQQVAEELLGMYGNDYHDGRNLELVQAERQYIRNEYDNGTSAYDVAIDIGYTCG